MRLKCERSKTAISCIVRASIIAGASILSASASFAQSAYDCRGLASGAALPFVEGKDGTFFSILPELQSHHGMGDHTISMLAELDAALASQGTTLVLLPVPTRAQVLADKLPPMASHLGYDVGNSTAVHEEMMARLKAKGLTVADALSDLRSAALSGSQPFFQSDARPTTTGMRILAKSVGEALAAHPNHRRVRNSAYRSVAGDQMTLPSAMHHQLQAACQSDLPTVSTQSYKTSKANTAAAERSTSNEENLVVLGTDISATTALNLAGFLSEATNLAALNYGVVNGGGFAAISSYMTSAVFQTAKPSVLVWEFPVSTSLARNGDQPLRELILAAHNTCTTSIAVTRSSNGDRLNANLEGARLGADAALLLDGESGSLAFVRFHFKGEDGLVRTRSIYRHSGQILTGRFYLPLAGLSAADLSSVEIEGPSSFGPDATLSICS